MIDVKELMIGNWVMMHGNPEQVEVRLLDAAEAWPESFDPIPLDAALLEKCGFEKDILGYSINLPCRFNKHRSLSVAYNTDDATPKYYTYYRAAGKNPDNRMDDDLCQLRHDLQYLHQLQNLYQSIVGQTLPITL